ncbi:MAG: type II toxin-antitoxin system PemK/MazF family toxin [Acidimicrobiia bacterium]
MVSADALWLVDFGEPFASEPSAHRPPLILGAPDTFGPAFPFVIVVPPTTERRGLSLHIEVEATPVTGLDDTSSVQCELIRSVSAARLDHRLGRSTPQPAIR